MNKLENKAKKLLFENRRTVGNYQFTIPSPHEYRHQWLWDSCFHAISLRHFDIDAAEKELLSLVASQNDNGMVPHESKGRILGLQLPFTSRITQAPFIARAALDVYAKGKSRDFIDSIFPKLQLYHHWLELSREAGGVYSVPNANETGEDNSILWDSYMPLPLHRAYGFLSAYLPIPQLPPIKHVGMTSVYADSLECMSSISRILGKPRLEKYYFYKHTAVARAAARIFVQDDGHYYDRTSGNRVIRRKTHSLFSPLFAGMLSKKDAAKLVNSHLLNEDEFWTKFPVPTVAADEKKFNPKGYWRGPSWINMNWMIHRGLLRYGMKRVASELLEKTELLVKKSGFREYYNPLTGEGLGAHNFSWSTLVVDMVRQRLNTSDSSDNA